MRKWILVFVLAFGLGFSTSYFSAKGDDSAIDPWAFVATVSNVNYQTSIYAIKNGNTQYPTYAQLADYYDGELAKIGSLLDDCDDSTKELIDIILREGEAVQLIEVLRAKGDEVFKREDTTKNQLDGVYLEVKGRLPC